MYEISMLNFLLTEKIRLRKLIQKTMTKYFLVIFLVVANFTQNRVIWKLIWDVILEKSHLLVIGRIVDGDFQDRTSLHVTNALIVALSPIGNTLFLSFWYTWNDVNFLLHRPWFNHYELFILLQSHLLLNVNYSCTKWHCGD